jgi:hypothetical protein
MELIFNELSKAPPAADKYAAREKMAVFVGAVAESRRKNFTVIKSDMFEREITLAEDYSLKDWLFDKEVQQMQKDFLFGFIKPPFMGDDATLELYMEGDYFFVHPQSGELSCLGLTAAYFYETATISLPTSDIWMTSTLLLNIRKAGVITTHDLFNISKKSDYENPATATFVENLGEVTLEVSEITPADKPVVLAGDHHGQKELAALGNKLKQNVYVLGMRSTNFGGSNFIRKVYADGKIEIASQRSDERFALLVETTGRDMRETKEIARLLEERYS